jgi:N-acetylglucosamine-6-phosphate deacetylase
VAHGYADRVTVLLHSAMRIDERGEVADAWVLFDGDEIAETGSAATPLPSADEIVDLGGARLVPGFIDLHGHGGGGHAFDDGREEILAGLAPHRARGTTRSVLSLVANPLVDLRSSLTEIAELCAADPLILGSHLEGPYLAPDRRGAHNLEYLRDPDPVVIDELIGAAHGTLRQITIAPELPGALDAIEFLADHGIVVAVGHTGADIETARAAFDRGATLLTHTFNAMPGIHHRDPGPIVAAFDDERVVLELILDGSHVHPDVAGLTFESAPGRVALVTDAMAAAASADGDYRLGSLNVSVRSGVALLSGTHTLAGSTLTQDAALRLAVDRVGVSWPDAVAALTAVPARALGLQDRFGLLAPGYVADAVVLDAEGMVTAVWAAGKRL